MKRGFVRLLFGDFESEQKGKRRRSEKHIHNRLKSTNKVDFVTYVFGEENEKILNDLGVKTVLVHKEPFMWKPEERRMWWHKLYIYQYIMQEDHYDEFVYLDWDCFLNKPLFDNFWERMDQKEDFQAPLCSYRQWILRHSQHMGRDEKSGKVVPNGGFVYIRNKSIPDKIWEFANVGSNKWLDEAAYAKYIDDRMGKWIGTAEYMKLFEPEVCRWNGKGPYKRTPKDNCFRHR